MGLGQAFGHHGIGDTTVLHGGFEQMLELGSGMGFGFVVRVFQQHAKRPVGVQRHAQRVKVFGHQAQSKLAHHLKPGQTRARSTE